MKVKRKISTAPGSFVLLPEHLRHFKEGGLNEKTIASAGFRSTPVRKVEKALKLSLGGVRSAYQVPYPYFDGYLRYRVFPAYVSPDGKKRKYIQAIDSSPHLYFHPNFPKDSFTNSSTPLYLIEGEKKVLALGQQGIFAVLGFPGVWGWSKDKFLLPDFDLVSWQGRSVFIVPDSDVWTNENSKRAIYALSRELEARGAKLSVVVLPSETKGLDDYLLEHTVKEFLELEAISPRSPRFHELEQWYEERNKRNKETLLSLISPSSREWPKPLNQNAFYGLAGKFVELINPHTEADPGALLSQFIVCFGNLIGRKAHFSAEGSKHYFNMYMILIGQTAKGRKGSAWSQVKRIFSLVDPEWHDEHIKSGLSSGEGLIWSVRDAVEITKFSKKTKKSTKAHQDPGIVDKRLLVYESELASVLNVMRRDGNILTGVIRDAWDNGNLSCLTKTNPAKATDAHISIVAHVTEEELRLLFRPTDARNGFGNRFVWLCVKRSKLLPEGGNPPALQLVVMAKKIGKAANFAKDVDEMTRDAEASQLWRDVYPILSKERSGMLGGLIGRSEAQVMRVAGIYALLDLSSSIKKPHLEAALAFWGYAESSLVYLYGDSLGDEIADKIVTELRRRAPKGMTLSEMGEKLFSKHYDPQAVQSRLTYLLTAGFITVRERKTPGRSAQEFFAVVVGTP